MSDKPVDKMEDNSNGCEQVFATMYDELQELENQAKDGGKSQHQQRTLNRMTASMIRNFTSGNASSVLPKLIPEPTSKLI